MTDITKEDFYSLERTNPEGPEETEAAVSDKNKKGAPRNSILSNIAHTAWSTALRTVSIGKGKGTSFVVTNIALFGEELLRNSHVLPYNSHTGLFVAAFPFLAGTAVTLGMAYRRERIAEKLTKAKAEQRAEREDIDISEIYKPSSPLRRTASYIPGAIVGAAFGEALGVIFFLDAYDKFTFSPVSDKVSASSLALLATLPEKSRITLEKYVVPQRIDAAKIKLSSFVNTAKKNVLAPIRTFRAKSAPLLAPTK